MPTAEEEDGVTASGLPLRPALRAARRQIRRRKLTRFYQNRLRRVLPLPLVSLPFLYQEEIGPDALRALAARIEAA